MPYSNAGTPPPRRRFLLEAETPHRLGRHVNHDPRSLRFAVRPSGIVQSRIWQRRIPVLDQGDLGSCTGNATVGVLGTEPYFSALTPVQRQALNEDEAVRLYSQATQLDPWDGAYPPEDTGSDGLSVAKAAVKFGYLSGYQHVTSVAAAQTAIQAGPFIVGTVWLDGMFTPSSSGEVTATGPEAGGHEYECYGYEADADRWLFWNSWGTSWGVGGGFWMSGATFAALLAQQGDATTFVPVTQPAPTPTPAPAAAFPTAAWEAFVAHPYSIVKRKAAVAAVDAYRAAL
jgi:hypothetical protein